MYFIGFSLGALFWGTISDHLGRRPCMLFGLLFYTLASTICIFTSQIYFLLSAMLLQAFGASVGSVITMAMVRDSYATTKMRNYLFAMVGGTLAFAHALGPVIGGYLVYWLNWQANFIFLSLVGLLLFIYFYKTLPETHRSLGKKHLEHHLGRLLLRILKDKRVLSFAFLIAAFNGILFSYYAEAPYIFVHILKLSPIAYGLSNIVIAVSWWVGSRCSTLLSQSWSSEKLILLSCCLVLIGAVLLLSAATANWITAQHISSSCFILLLSMFFIFIGFGIGIPNCLGIALNDYQPILGSAGALFGLIYYILIACFTAIMSIIHNGNIITMPIYFTVIAITMLSVSYLSIYSSKRAH